jgi:hypothetical protein
MQATSSRLLTTYGESISCTRAGNPGTYDPADLSVTLGTQTAYTGVGLPTNYSQDEIDGDSIQEGDSLVLFYSTTEPEVGDTFTFNSTDYNVISISKSRAQGENVLYKVQVRI